MQYIYYYFSEIRIRFLYVIIACVLSFITSYFFKVELFYLFSKPFLSFSNQFIFFELTEGLYTMIRISLIISIIPIIPYMSYHVWSFGIPSCYIFERKKINFYLFLYGIFFLVNFLLIYWIVFPKFCAFLLSFEMKSVASSSLSIEFMPRIASYIQLIIQLFSLFFLLYQLPFIFLGLFTKNIITAYNLCEHRKIIFFLCLLFSAFVSPPDLLSQLFLSSLFYCLYEFIIFLGFFYQPLNASHLSSKTYIE